MVLLPVGLGVLAIVLARGAFRYVMAGVVVGAGTVLAWASDNLNWDCATCEPGGTSVAATIALVILLLAAPVAIGQRLARAHRSRRAVRGSRS